MRSGIEAVEIAASLKSARLGTFSTPTSALADWMDLCRVLANTSPTSMVSSRSKRIRWISYHAGGVIGANPATILNQMRATPPAENSVRRVGSDGWSSYS
jgi:hypothetical protein